MNELTPQEKLQILSLKGKMSGRKIADVVGRHHSTVNRFLSEQGEVVEQDDSPLGDFSAPFTIKTSNLKSPGKKRHLVIPDTQVKEGVPLQHLEWAGQFAVETKPDVIVHLGDHADMPSLSSYDRGKKSSEGRRVEKDIKAAIKGMEVLLGPIHKEQKREKETIGEVVWRPRLVLTLGNHENRIKRHVEANPELDGFLSIDSLKYEEFGWEVYDFLEPVCVDGVTYSHFMANPFTGNPYGGSAMNILKHVGQSFTMGHKQTLDMATRFLPTNGEQQWGIIAGAFYQHDEEYKSYQGNKHWRGIILKERVINGSYDPTIISLDSLRERYGKENKKKP